eukprot:3746213-Rhodomonas_salina.2
MLPGHCLARGVLPRVQDSEQQESRSPGPGSRGPQGQYHTASYTWRVNVPDVYFNFPVRVTRLKP